MQTETCGTGCCVQVNGETVLLDLNSEIPDRNDPCTIRECMVREGFVTIAEERQLTFLCSCLGW